MTRIGDQLELGLGDVVDGRRRPWGGRSPRVLTRGHGLIILEAQAEKSMGDVVDPRQHDAFIAPVGRGSSYGGAPLLVPFDYELSLRRHRG